MVFSIFRSKKTVDELAKESARKAAPKNVTPSASGGGKSDRKEDPADLASAPSPDDVQQELESFGLEKSEFVDDYAPLEFDGGMGSVADESSIEVVESTESVDPVIEQAAMLYAGGQSRETVVLLEDVLRADPNVRIEIWLMLFELYTLLDNRAMFDELALKFAEKFKRSAPDWEPIGLAKTTAKTVVSEVKTGSGYFAFASNISAETFDSQLQTYVKADAKGGSIRVEFSKVQDIDADSAAKLQEWLHKKTDSPRQWQGLESLSRLLATKYEVMRPDAGDLPFWLLQLDILQLIGQQEDFENVAVDYAVTFEVSPPSWDLRKVTQEVVSASDFAPQADPDVPENSDDDLFSLAGVIADGKGDQLTAMRQYATSHQHIRLDMKRVVRMDFSSAGWLLNMLIAFQQEGKQITITGAGELLIGLFRVLGITELAQVVRRR